MKTVYFTKDCYQNNTVRVNYFGKNSTRQIEVPIINEETGECTLKLQDEIYDKLLFCQRLEWVNEENEFDQYIEEVRQYWENRINS
jgi:hypothetical protein